MSEEEYCRGDQKDEKEEKEEKPGERREGREWAQEEKWARDPLGGLILGLIIICAGLALVVVNLGTFPWLTWDNVWSLLFIGAGLLFLLEIVIRLVIPTYRRPIRGRLILAFILLVVGAGGFIGWELTWPLILVAVGLAIIVGVLIRPRF
jgi:hypothetical protein